ncbi:MAG: alpha/beta hydrolase [Tenericutes bacterium]|nr:alpha/beta hydrolase [Mycoplasmatota bacterium]
MYFKYKDINLYYEQYGNGKENIIIFPGWGDNRLSFIPMINMLKNDFSIYIVDYPGFGKSNFPNNDLNILDYAYMFVNFINNNKINNPILIGHSFGGRIIIALCGILKINVQKIILIDSAGIKRRKKLFVRTKERIYKRLKKIKLPKCIFNKYNELLIKIFGSSDFKNLNPSIRKTFINIVNYDLTDFLTNIKEPTLIIWGEKDQDTPLADGILMEKKIKDSGLVIIKNTHHFCYLENFHVNYIIREFLKTTTATASSASSTAGRKSTSTTCSRG